ncbi:MAG TPA: PEGA domain-containing protein, partial [Kofleriaceae bacterium]|nr:PEGA domain-containing protein [Kofleriaceae bacterium]
TPTGASIMVGGKRVGTTPATISVALPAAILVTRSGYRPSRVRAVRAGPVDVRLTPNRPARPAPPPRPAAGETLD